MHTQYKIMLAETYITLKLDGELSDQTAQNFIDDFPKMVLPSHHIVVQCENLSGMTPKWVRALVMLEKEARKLNRMIRFIQVSPKMEMFFKQQGVDRVFKQAKGLRDALTDLGLASAKVIDTDFINPFLLSTMKVLEIQAKTKAMSGKIFLKTQGERFSGDISGVIGLVSDAFSGSVVISFPEKTFLAVVSRMFGENFTTITKELEDGAAELTNIIFGQAKIGLNEKGYGIKTALPSVITGKDHSVASAVRGVTVVVPFQSDAGEFFVEINTASP